MEALFSVDGFIALLTLAFLEIVLGIDNIIFISILTNRLPREKQAKIRNLGLALSLIFRILLLFGISWLIHFQNPLFNLFGIDLSGKDLILAAGGLFLLWKSTMEIHKKVSAEEETHHIKAKTAAAAIIAQIVMIDIVFSFDSILTAVGLTEHLPIMITAVIIAIIIMMLFSGQVSRFINSHPTLQVLALSFLILIAVMLIVEGFHQHVPKGYIYFSVFFSLIVEMINMRIRKKQSQKKQNKTE